MGAPQRQIQTMNGSQMVRIESSRMKYGEITSLISVHCHLFTTFHSFLQTLSSKAVYDEIATKHPYARAGRTANRRIRHGDDIR